jgi:hypothetical protein
LIKHARACTFQEPTVWAANFASLSPATDGSRKQRRERDDEERRKELASKRSQRQAAEAADEQQRIADAQQLWYASECLFGTAAERYLIETRHIPRPAAG